MYSGDDRTVCSSVAITGDTKLLEIKLTENQHMQSISYAYNMKKYMNV